MTQFATALQLSTYLTGEPATVEELDPAFVRQAELLIRLVSADIQSAAGATIEAGTGTVFLDGSFGEALELPQRPVRSVSAVTVNGYLLAPTAYTWDGRQILRRGSIDPEQFAGELAHWGGPRSVIGVEYAWGSDAVPDRILSLTLRATARVLGNPTELRQETLGIYSASYADLTKDGSHILRSERDWLRRAYNRTAGTIRTR